jgi:GR25 family glycosyltransferase involved in LPS biosynthesis
MGRLSSIVRHFKGIENKVKIKQIKNIDFIYLINLDFRTEKLEKSLVQFAKYDIHPYRFSAVWGGDLTQETFDDIAMPILPSTRFDRPVLFGPSASFSSAGWIDRSCVGKHCVHHTMTSGALGCYLSHLSLLFDAYESSYQVIWILEDDISLSVDPHELADYVDKLDALVGKGGWDILYTDIEDHFTAPSLRRVMEGSWGRPGIPLTSSLVEYQALGPDIIKIGGRHHTHSMIIRRSGIEKILDFVTSQGMFRPYDFELAFVPNIKLFNVSRDLVHSRNRTISDTANRS